MYFIYNVDNVNKNLVIVKTHKCDFNTITKLIINNL